MKKIFNRILAIKPVNAIRIISIYFFFSLIWIVFSDRILVQNAIGIHNYGMLATIKGIFYLLFTSLFLYLLIRNAINTINHEKNRALSSERQYRVVAENMNDVIWIIDIATLKFSYVSPSVQKLLGFTPEEILVRPIDKILVPNYSYLVQDELPTRLKQYEEGDKSWKNANYKVQQIHKNGSIIDVEITTSLIEDKFGKVTEIYGRSRDITESEKNEAALRDREERFRTLVENIPGAVFRTELSGSWRIIYMSDEIKNICGWDFKSFTKAQINYSDIIHPDDLQKVKAEVTKCVEETKSYEIDYRIIHADGSERYVIERGKAIYDLQGVPLYVDGLIIDITEKKKIENTLNVLATSFSDLSGKSFFENVSKHIALSLGIDFAFVGELTDNTHSVQVLGGYGKGEFLNPFKYDLKEAPCKNIIKEKICFYSSGVQQLFPNDYLLAKMGIDGYLGLPLFNKDGDALGIFVLLNCSPIKNDKYASTLFQIFSDRVIAEIERSEAERKLKESEIRWQFALEGAGEGVWDWNAETDEVFYSKRWKEMLGFDDDDVIYKIDEWEKRVHPDDLPNVFEQLGKHVEGKEAVYISEHRVKCKDGSYKWVLDRGKVVARSKDGKILRAIGTHTDIDERKKIEKALEEERMLFVSGKTVVFKWKNGNASLIEYLSPNIKDQFGYEVSDFLTNKKYYNNIVHPEDLPRVQNEAIEYIQNGKLFYEQEYRILHANGNYRWVYDFTIVGKDSSGVITHRNIYIQDITDRKEAENTILKSELKYRQLFEANKDGIAIFPILNNGSIGTFIELNNAAVEMQGFSKEEMMRFTPNDLEVGITPDKIAKRQENILNDGVTTFETILVHKNGSHINAEIKVILIRYNDQPALMNIVRDITERKKSENTLRKSESNLSTAVKIAKLGHWEYDVIGNEFLFNDHFYKLFHTSVGEVGTYSLTPDEYAMRFVYPDDRIMVFEAIKDVLDKSNHSQEYKIEHRILYADGGVGYISVLFNIVRDEFGNAIRTYGVNQDITERVQILNAIRESEEKFRLSFMTSPDSVNINRLSDGLYIDANEGFSSLTGFTKDDVVGKTSEEINIWFDMKDRQALIDELMVNGICRNLVARFRLKNGKVKTGLMSAVIITVQDEKCILSLTRDISEFTQIQMDLEESEARYRELYNLSPDAIIVHQDGKIIFANPASLRIVGAKSENELLNMNMIDFVHPDFRNIVISRVHEMSSTNHPVKALYEKFLRLDGSSVDVEVVSTPISLKGKIAYQVIVRDITERKKAEEILRESEQKLTALINSTPDIICFKDAEGRWLKANNGILEVYGLKGVDYFNKTEWEMAPLTHQRYQEAFRTCNVTDELSWLKGTQSRTEEIIPDVNSSTHVFDVIKIPLFNDDGSRKAMVVFGRDITERKKSERALRLEKDKFSKTFFTSPDGVIINKIENAEIVELNEGFSNITGFSRDELLNKSARELNLWVDESKRIESKTKLLSEGSYKNLETKVRTKNGDYVDVLISASRIELEDEECVLYMIRDISELKKVEIALRESEERYRDLFNHLLDGFAYHEMVLDENDSPIDYIFLAANPRYEQLTGLKIENIIGRGIIEIMPDESKYWIDMYSSVASNNIAKRFESFNEITGKYYRVLAYSPEKFKFATIIEDITEKVLSEKELEMYRTNLEALVKLRTAELDTANKKLIDELRKDKEYEMMLQDALQKEKELSDLKTRFISTASHEFRTPLTSILSSSELIERYRKKWGEEKFEEHFARIKKSVDYLTKLLDDVLIISRTDAGKIVFDPSPTEINEFCEDVLREASVHSTSKHELLVNYQVKQKTFLLDQKLMRFILVNLIANAFKYSPNGGKIEFSIRATKTNLIFVIKDEGIGIPKDEIHYMFQPFHRNKNSKDIPGTGLGLSIVKRSVDLHQGRISFESELNKGTIFTVNIPVLSKNL